MINTLRFRLPMHSTCRQWAKLQTECNSKTTFMGAVHYEKQQMEWKDIAFGYWMGTTKYEMNVRVDFMWKLKLQHNIRSLLGDTCHVSPWREPMPLKNLSSHLSPHFVPSSVSAHLSVLRKCNQGVGSTKKTKFRTRITWTLFSQKSR